MNATVTDRRSAIIAACQLADSFKGLSRNRGTQAGTLAFQGALDALVTLAFSDDHRGMALTSAFASRVEASGPETTAMIAAAMKDNPQWGEDKALDFRTRMEAQVQETAYGFMLVTGLPASAICPKDYATLSRFWLHLVNLRMG